MQEKRIEKSTLTFEKFVKLTRSNSSSQVVTTLTELLTVLDSLLKKKVNDKHGASKEKLFSFFGKKSDEYGETKVITIKALDTVVVQHLQHIPSEAFVTIVATFFKDVGDNFNIVLIAVRELIRRKDKSAQVKVATLYFKATEYYDGGHRYREKTVQDQLIDVYFPQFETEALLVLLSTKQMDFLSSDGGDGMEDLFLPAFKGAKSSSSAVAGKLERIFIRYIDYCSSRITPYPDNSLVDFIATIKPYLTPSSLKKVMSRESHSNRIHDAMVAVFSDDISNIEKVVLQFGDTISHKDFALLEPKLRSLPFSSFSFETLEHYFHFYLQYIFLEKVPKKFRNSDLVAALLAKDFMKASGLLKEAAVLFFEKNPDAKVWVDIFDDVVETKLTEVKADIDNKEFIAIVALASEVTKQSKKEIISNAVSGLVRVFVTSRVQVELTLSRGLVALLKKKKVQISLGAYLETIVSVMEVEEFLYLLPFLSLTKKDTHTFFLSSISVLMENDEWKLFDTVVGQYSKKIHGLYVFDNEMSERFASAVGSSILSSNSFAKSCYARFKKIQLTSIATERVLAQLIGDAVNKRNNKLVLEMLTRVPKKITWNTLAYNLACYYAWRKDKKNLLSMAKHCIVLGSSAEQFLDDSDFDSFVEDKEFLAAIGGEHETAEREYAVFTKPFVAITKTKKDNSDIKKQFKIKRRG